MRPPSNREERSHDKLNDSMLLLYPDCCNITRGNVPYANKEIASEKEVESELLLDDGLNNGGGGTRQASTGIGTEGDAATIVGSSHDPRTPPLLCVAFDEPLPSTLGLSVESVSVSFAIDSAAVSRVSP